MNVSFPAFATRILNRMPELSSAWRGKTVSLLDKRWMALALLAVVGTVVYLAKRRMPAPPSSSGSMPPLGTIPSTATASLTTADANVLFSELPLPAAGLSFPIYDKNRDRYAHILQPRETMVPVFDKGKQIAYNGAKFTSPRGRVYVLMQGPMASTMNATRDMVAQNKVKQIVCLTNDKEGNTEKCHKYWGNWNVQGSSLSGWTRVSLTKNTSWTTVKMFHYVDCPDQGIPENLHLFIAFVQDQRRDSHEGAVAVHCSGGLGATAIFMVATLIMDQIEDGKQNMTPADVLAIIGDLRRARPGMIQTVEQLDFCFKVAQHLLSKRSAPIS